jgi:hypothetical protein
MKRMLLAALATSMLALFAPAIAAAQHGHHHRGHARTHKGHAKTSRVVLFGSASALTPSATPTTPIVKPEPEKAGTIESFKEGPPKEGVLTIKLTDGSLVSGKVTEQTQIHCPTPPPEPSDNDDDQGGGDEEGGNEGDEHGASPASGSFGSQHGDVMAHSACDQRASEAGNQRSCTTASLVKGAVVLAAELKLTPAGPVWEQVVLG